MKIVFFGTSEFGAIILKKLIQAGLLPVLVVTTLDKPAGRKQELTPPPVKILAKTYGLEIFQPEKLEQATSYKLQATSPDLFIVASYGKILPKEILYIPKYGALNVHPSMLPKYRGPSPIQTAILNGDKETGVSIILMDEKMDHGPILTNSKLQIANNKYTYKELHNKLAEIGADLLITTIPGWIEGRVKPIPQDENKATHTRILKKEDGRIDWNKEAGYIERQVRALNPWPGTYTKCQMSNDKFQKTLKILKTSVLSQDRPLGKPGQTFSPPLPGIAVQTGKDALFLEELQMEGGKPMPSKEFLLGYKNFLGTIFD